MSNSISIENEHYKYFLELSLSKSMKSLTQRDSYDAIQYIINNDMPKLLNKYIKEHPEENSIKRKELLKIKENLQIKAKNIKVDKKKIEMYIRKDVVKYKTKNLSLLYDTYAKSTYLYKYVTALIKDTTNIQNSDNSFISYFTKEACKKIASNYKLLLDEDTDFFILSNEISGIILGAVYIFLCYYTINVIKSYYDDLENEKTFSVNTFVKILKRAIEEGNVLHMILAVFSVILFIEGCYKILTYSKTILIELIKRTKQVLNDNA